MSKLREIIMQHRRFQMHIKLDKNAVIMMVEISAPLKNTKVDQ